MVPVITAAARPGDVVVAMSNGAFGGIWDRLLAALGGR
jgi:UDP-N-acetylmuramate: L-alanyl-gamma-D-glutamyl-meso-diaminopimelate ligase